VLLQATLARIDPRAGLTDEGGLEGVLGRDVVLYVGDDILVAVGTHVGAGLNGGTITGATAGTRRVGQGQAGRRGDGSVVFRGSSMGVVVRRRQVGRRGVQAGGFGDGAVLEDVGGELVGALFGFVRRVVGRSFQGSRVRQARRGRNQGRSVQGRCSLR